MSGSRTRTLRAVAIMAVLLPSVTAFAQSDPQDLRQRGLEPTRVTNDALGVTIHPPLDSAAIPTQTGDSTILTIRDGADPPAWQMFMQRTLMRDVRSDDPDEIIELLLSQLRRNNPSIQVLRNEARRLGGHPGHILFVQLEQEIGGFAIAATGERRFLIVRMSIMPEVSERIRPILEASLGTLEITSAEQLRAQREAQTNRAQRFLGELTPERFRSVLGREHWYRIYQPSADGSRTGEQEVGYFVVRTSEGMRGQLDPGREERHFTAGDRAPGLILHIDGRYLEDAARNLFTDVQSRYWQAWDRSDESWSIRATRRQGAASRTEAEVGLRSGPRIGQPYGKVTVVTTDLQTRANQNYEWIAPDPYLSQVEVYLLGSLLPRDGSMTGELAFRYYEPSVKRLTELPHRLDVWQPSSRREGFWTLTSRLMIDTPPITSTYNAEGVLIRREKADGTITELIELRDLVELWRRKGLPTGD